MAELLTPTEAAFRLKVDERTLRRWRGQNIGAPFIKRGGRFFYRSDLLTGFGQFKGLQERFPADRIAIVDGSALTAEERETLDLLLAKAPIVDEWEIGSKLALMTTESEFAKLLSSDREMQVLVDMIATKLRPIVDEP